MRIEETFKPMEKAGICNDTLRALPDWFGIEASIVDYTNEVQSMAFYAAFDAETPIGFVALKAHNPFTAEVYVMAVRKEYHRQGVGRALIECCEDFCRKNEHEFLTVKTLDEAGASSSYDNTRLFYFSTGFRPLEVSPTCGTRIIRACFWQNTCRAPNEHNAKAANRQAARGIAADTNIRFKRV